MRIFSTALLCLVPAIAAAAPTVRDLGRGLAYDRVHQLPDDLPATTFGATVLDVRYVHANPPAAAAFVAWLKAHVRLHDPVLLLANPQTSPALLAPFATAEALPGLIIIGPALDRFATDIAVPVSEARERKAYDALESGAPIESLIDYTPEKQRNDEARLAREHLSDAEMAADDSPPKADPPAQPPPLTDSILQRAVQLHRAMLALGRL
jgi:hypothetical protein